MNGIGLTPAQLAAVFPFHVGCDGDLIITQAGSGWARVSEAVRPGASMADCFRIMRPELPFAAQVLRNLEGSLLVLECLSNGLPLRGQIVPVSGTNDLLFIGSPWVREAADLERFGLSPAEWPPHEAVTDFLFLLRAKEVALKEAGALAERLRQQQADMRAAVHQLEQAQAVITTREASLRAILDTAAEGIVTVDEHGTIQSFNVAASQLFGWTPDEVIGTNVNILIPPPIRGEHDGYLARYRQTGVPTIIGRSREVEGLRRDGTRFPLQLAVSEVQGPHGRTFTGILRDLTELKAAQQALETSEARTRLIVDTALDAVISIDQAGLVTLWNAQAEAMFGWTRTEAIGRSLSELAIPPSLRSAHAEGMQRYLATGEGRVLGRRIEITAAHRDGREFPVELAITPYQEGDRLSFSGFVRDISVRKRAEQLLRTQYEVGSILALGADLATVAPRLLRAACEYLGWSVAALWVLDAASGGLRCVDVWHEPDLDAADFVAQTRRVVFPSGVGLPGRVLASGEYLWLPAVSTDPNFPRAATATAAGIASAIGLPMAVEGHVGGVLEFFSRQLARPDADEINTLSSLAGQIGQFIDRQRAEQALRQSQARLQSLVDYMLEGLVVVGDGLRILEANPAYSRIFGYSREELVGMPVTLLMADRPEYQDPAMLSRIYRASLGKVTEHEGRRKSGEVFPLQLQLYEVMTPDGRVIAGHVRDLSQERESERLKKRFVASVSHELRTPLTAIRGSLGLLAKGAVGELPADAKDVVTMAERNAVRLVGIINDLLDFERIQAGLLSLSRASFPLDRAVARSREAVEELARQSGITIASSPSGLDAWGDEARIIQVLVNLLGNAIKFSSRGTEVDIAVEARANWAEVRVRDRGRGVPAELRDVIFQPFRQVEESDARRHGGSGMGLAICRAIITQHGGRIGVDSQRGDGATFWFTIPLTPGEGVSNVS